MINLHNVKYKRTSIIGYSSYSSFIYVSQLTNQISALVEYETVPLPSGWG